MTDMTDEQAVARAIKPGFHDKLSAPDLLAEEAAGKAIACIRARDRERAGELVYSLRCRAPHGQDADLMNDAADTLSSLQSSLREKEAECERLNFDTIAESRLSWLLYGMSESVPNDPIARRSERAERAESALAAARETLRECGRYFAENNANEETEAMLELTRALLETP